MATYVSSKYSISYNLVNIKGNYFAALSPKFDTFEKVCDDYNLGNGYCVFYTFRSLFVSTYYVYQVTV